MIRKEADLQCFPLGLALSVLGIKVMLTSQNELPTFLISLIFLKISLRWIGNSSSNFGQKSSTKLSGLRLFYVQTSFFNYNLNLFIVMQPLTSRICFFCFGLIIVFMEMCLLHLIYSVTPQLLAFWLPWNNVSVPKLQCLI